MKSQTHITYILIITLLAVLALMGWTANGNKRDVITNLKADIAFKNSTIDSFKNKYDQVVYESKVNMAASDELIKVLSEQIFQLEEKDEKRVKEVQSLTVQVQKLKLTPPVIKYTDTGSKKPPEFYTNDSLVHKDSVVIPPKKFSDQNEHYSISGTVLLEGVRLDSVVLVDTNSIRIIEQKPKGFIKRLTKPNETVLQNIHSNPYIKTIGIQEIRVKPKTNTWNKIIKPVLFFAAGVFMVKL